jgi:NAD(P)-dependent dehydrogenase (short-subunit alcohol dehydrogenase family)
MPLNPTISDWRGKTVWLIGASTGIGFETAKLLIAKGARLAVSARSGAPLQQLAALAPDRVIAAPLDVTQPALLAQTLGTLEAAWGAIPDLTLVVAGTHTEMRAFDFDRAAAQKLLDVNLGGPLNVMEVLLPKLIENAKAGKPAVSFKGIGFVSSVAGYRGLPKALIYGPSKAALINLAESLYIDLNPLGIAVYCINPGFIDTPLTQKNDFEMPDLMSPQDAAVEFVKGLEDGEFEITFPKSFVRKMKLAQLLPNATYFATIRKTVKL